MGDYVLAFALPGPGVPSPDTAGHGFAGRYTGELRVGDARIGMALAISESGDSLVGTVTRIDSVRVSGPVVLGRSGEDVTVRFPFVYPARSCEGSVAGLGRLWNGGRVLEGDLTLTGSCGDGGRPEPGSFVLWKEP